jgi:hypothetical protein
MLTVLGGFLGLLLPQSHQHDLVPVCQESAINKYYETAMLERLIKLREQPIHSMKNKLRNAINMYQTLTGVTPHAQNLLYTWNEPAYAYHLSYTFVLASC